MATRPPVLNEAALTTDQQLAFDEITSGPRGVVEGPLRVWLQSPGLARHAQALGAYCRYQTVLPPRLSELAIIVVGAHWRSGFEWHVHAPIAIQAGLDPKAVEAIRVGERPLLEDAETNAVYEFVSELVSTKQVSHTAYTCALEILGVRGVVDLTGIIGYYSFISMTINVFKVAVPSGTEEPFPDP